MNRFILISVALLVSIAHSAELKILDIAIEDSTVGLEFYTDVSGFSVADLHVESKNDLLNDVWRDVSSDLFTERVENVYEGHSVTGGNCKTSLVRGFVIEGWGWRMVWRAKHVRQGAKTWLTRSKPARNRALRAIG